MRWQRLISLFFQIRSGKDTVEDVMRFESFSFGYFLLCTGAVYLLTLVCQAEGGYRLLNDPVAAWKEIRKVHEALRPPVNWRTAQPKPEEIAEFQKQFARPPFHL